MRKLLTIIVLLSCSIVHANSEHWNTENLKGESACLLQIVRNKMSSSKVSSPPRLKTEMETPLSEFQEAMGKYWGFRPEFFLNVYDFNTNSIYLMTQKKTYKHPRTAVDSLVHELVHFVQYKDQGQTQDEMDFLESEAIAIQTWFRDNLSKYIIDEKYQGPCNLSLN
jgi:hypothetical protein